MLSHHLQQLQSVLKKNRRSNQYESQFMITLHNCQKPQSLRKKFLQTFPHLIILKDQAQFQHRHSLGTNPSEKSVHDSYTQLPQSNEKDHEVYKKAKQLHKKNFLQPQKQSNEEIENICDAFKTARHSNSDEFLRHLYREYCENGGEKTFSELKAKLQIDLLYLIKKINQKGKHQK